MKPIELPSPELVARFGQGAGKARRVRALYRERCNVAEIALALDTSGSYVRWALRMLPPAKNKSARMLDV